MVIFLVGYMGCGKTTIGKKVSRLSGITFMDMDAAIEQQEGMSVSEIFSTKGEQAFRAMELEWLKKQSESEDDVIVATGGGVPCYGDNMQIMNGLGCSVYLKFEPEKLVSRLSLRGRAKRPLLRGLNDEELLKFISEKLIERDPYYSKASLIIDCNNVGDEYICAKIISMLKK